MGTVIHDGQSNFVGFNCRSWVASGDGDLFEGTYPNAVRVARNLDRAGRRVFVSKDYGLVSQEDREIFQNGDIGEPTFPNATAAY